MTAQLLSTELANLIQESKRKHSDLKQVLRPFPDAQRVCEQRADALQGRREVLRRA